MSIGPAYGSSADIVLSNVGLLVNAGSVAQGKVVAELSSGPTTADKDTASHADSIVGISIGGGLAAATGEVEFAGWSFTEGDTLYVDTNGDMTATIPTTGFQQRVAVATGTDTVVLAIGLAIVI